MRTSRLGFLWAVAAWYGAAEYATYTLSFAVFDVLLFAALAGFDNSLWNFIPRFHKTRPDLEGACLRTAIRIPFLAGLALGVVLYLGSDFVAETCFHKPALARGLRWMAAILPLAAPARILLAATRGLGIMKYHVIGVDFFEPAAMFLLLVLFQRSGGPAFAQQGGAFLAHLVSEVLVVLMALHFFRRHFSKSRVFHLSGAWFHRDTAHYAVALGGVNVSALLSRRLDIFLVGRYLPMERVAAYNLVSDLAFALVKIRTALMPAVAPILAAASAGEDREGLKRSLQESALWGTISALPLIVLFALFGARLISLFNLNPAFGYAALMFLGMGHFINTALGPVGEAISAKGRPLVYTLINGLPLLLVGVAGPFLIPTGGTLWAAALAGGGIAAAKFIQVFIAHSWYGAHPFTAALAEVWGVSAAWMALLFALRQSLPVPPAAQIILGMSTFCGFLAIWTWKRYPRWKARGVAARARGKGRATGLVGP